MKAKALLIGMMLGMVPLTVAAQSGNVRGSPSGRPSGRPDAGIAQHAGADHVNPKRAGGASGARFNQLSHGRSYITRAQARREDPTLYRHFSRCDTLRDGRVTRTEFKNCDGGHKK